jgi:putative Ig domain-containing protein/Big-like domain-containing protein
MTTVGVPRAARLALRLFVLSALAALSWGASAQTFAPPFDDGSYSVQPLDASAFWNGIQGLAFAPDDPNTLIVSTTDFVSRSIYYKAALTRDVSGHITSIGTPAVFVDDMSRNFPRAGLAYGPEATLFIGFQSSANLGEVPADASTISTTGVPGFGGSVTGLGFVPAGFADAGKLVIESYEGGSFYSADVVAQGNGLYSVANVVQTAAIAGQTLWAFAYLPAGGPHLSERSMVLTGNRLTIVSVDADGNPIVASQRTFLDTQNSWAAIVVDPSTGDLLATNNGRDLLVEIRGFTIIRIAPATLPPATVGASYGPIDFSASGGSGPYTFAVSAGALPPGVDVSVDGVLSGTPTAAGTFDFTVSATDSLSQIGSQSYTLTVGAAVLTLHPTAQTLNVVAASYYSSSFTATGGTAPYALGESGTLPDGLVFDAASGVLSGTATQAGDFPIAITATDSSTGTGAPFSVTNNYVLEVAAPIILVFPSSLPTASIAAGYQQTLTASGGRAPYTFAIANGSLPAGLTLSADGSLSGVPSAAGSFAFEVQATDALQFTGSSPYTLTVAPPTLVLAPASLPGGTVGAAYSQRVAADGGIAPYRYRVAAGALPGGLALDAVSGALSGTPDAAGNFAVTIAAVDSSTGAGAPFSVSRDYSIAIDAGVLAPVAGNGEVSVAANTPVTFDLAAYISGTATSVAIVTPPAHGELTVNGTTVTYGPANGFSGSDAFAYTATNAGGTSAAATITLRIAPPVAAAPLAAPALSLSATVALVLALLLCVRIVLRRSRENAP